jgi:rhodanese-related sulfurtransferase
MEQYLDFAIRNWTLFALLGVIVALLVGTELMRVFRRYKSVSVNEALSLYNDQDALLLDTREVAEFRDGHLPAARNIPLSGVKSKIGELESDRQRPIVVYCRTGSRSGGACNVLVKNGFEKVHNLSGGIQAWEGANLPITKGRK